MLSAIHSQAKVIFVLILFIGLFVIHLFPQNKNSVTDALQKTIQTESQYSKSFYQLEIKLLNEEIESVTIEKEINKKFKGFERDYLLGKLRKRNKNFEDAYELLLKHLDSKPSIFRYYDELVDLARITGNINDLLKKTAKVSRDDTYLKYLSGIAELELNNYKNAIEIFNDLIDSGIVTFELYYKIASAYRGIGDYQKGIDVLGKAEKLLDSNNVMLSKILNAEGSLYYLSANYEAAEKSYKSAYKISIKTVNVREKIRAVVNLSIIKDIYGDVYSARQDLIEIIPVAEKIQDHKLIALIYSELGVNYSYTNNIVDARLNYEKSYSSYSVLKNNERLSYLSSNIASIFLQQNNYKSALNYYRQGLEFAGENILGKILNLTGMADVFSNMSNYSKAIEYYKRAGQLADSVKDVSSGIKIDEGLGALYYNINKSQTALNFLKQAESKITIDGHPFEASEIFHKTGTVLSSMDSLTEAVDYLSNGLSIAQNSGDLYYEMILMTELGFTYHKMDNNQAAMRLLQKAYDLSSEYEQTQLMCLQQLYFGKIYFDLDQNQKARIALEKSLGFAIDAADLNTQIESSYYIAKLFESNNDVSNAEIWYKKSIDIIEKISAPLISNQEIQIAHFTGFNKIYDDLADLYLLNEKNIEAFETIEKSRSRNTYLNLNKLLVSSTVQDDELLNHMLDLEWMISSGLYDTTVTDSIKKEYDDLLNSFTQKDSKFSSLQELSRWKTLDEIQKQLNQDEVIISVFATDDNTWLFRVEHNEFSSTKVFPGRDSLISLLSEIAPIYKSDLASEEIYINQDLFSFNAKASWNLYNSIFKDELEKVKEGSTIIFSFPNELLLLPVEFLVTQWNDELSPFYYDDKKFLIEKFSTMYSPSASIYITQKIKKLSSNSNNLLLGDPSLGSEDFNISYRGALIGDDDISTRNLKLFPLEYSRQEIENVDNIISGSTVLLSEEATEENFKRDAPRSNIIHLSTHSFLYKNQPLIIVSKDKNSKEDGFLEIDEILNLNLNCDLVVLSSCRSGLGKIDEAEGILGMQKAFFDAGAGSIVVSIWDVNDKYTSYFMEEFYDALSIGMNKPAALRKAKLNFIKKYSANPYYWSAFILSGNPFKINTGAAAGTSTIYYILVALLVFTAALIFYKKRRF